MTRINVGVMPHELHDRHLLAEHREIVRIPNAINNNKAKFDGIPEYFKLGTGHVKFFYDKIGYLFKRYILLHQECIKRGFNVSDFSMAFNSIPKHLLNDYTPTDHDRLIVLERINQRLIEMGVK